MNHTVSRINILNLLILAALVCASLTGGCAKQRTNRASLEFTIPSSEEQVYSGKKSAFITTRDKRRLFEVIFYHSRSGTRSVPAIPPVTDILTSKLAKELSAQGLTLTRELPDSRLTLEIRELRCDIVRQKGLYRLKASTRILFTVDTAGNTLTRTYNRLSEDKSLTKPSVAEAEEMLQDQLEEIVTLILSDETVRDAIMHPQRKQS